jgi:Fic family protein
MVSIKELEDKRKYLISMRDFTEEEKIQLRNKFIIGNSKNIEFSEDAYSEEDKLLCINDNWDLREALKHNKRSYYYDELIGIISVYNYIQDVLNDEKKGFYKWEMSEDEIKWFNRIILYNYAHLLPIEKGFYRNNGIARLGDRILPSIDEFKKRLVELLIWYNRETNLDLISKIAYFHLIFEEEIHPFYDGNGRTGRAIMNLELALKGYPLINIKYNNLERYQLSFDEYRKDKSIETMRGLIIQEVDRELSQQILMKQRR